MTIDFYYMPESPPCRVVQLVADLLKIELNKKYLNLAKGQHLTEDFMKINPFHCVPTIVDGDLVLWESRAIVSYFVNKYAKDGEDSLYPKDPTARAKVDMLLYFDMGTLYKAQSELLKPKLEGAKELDTTKEKKFREALSFLEKLLSDNEFLAGNELTIADISTVCGLTFSEACDYDISDFKTLQAYLDRVKKSIPTYDQVTNEAIERFRAYVKSKEQTA